MRSGCVFAPADSVFHVCAVAAVADVVLRGETGSTGAVTCVLFNIFKGIILVTSSINVA